MTTVRVDWRDEADARLLAARGTRFGVEEFGAYRGRDLAGAHRVEVYRNLNEQKRTGAVRWSIRDNDSGLVLGHAGKVALTHVRVHVNRAAQRRIAAGEFRTVHAWVTGQLTFCPTDGSPWYLNAERVIYRPAEGPYFRFEDDDRVFTGTAGNQVVRFDDRGMWAWR